jgi:hypothetical protein
VTRLVAMQPKHNTAATRRRIPWRYPAGRVGVEFPTGGLC